MPGGDVAYGDLNAHIVPLSSFSLLCRTLAERIHCLRKPKSIAVGAYTCGWNGSTLHVGGRAKLSAGARSGYQISSQIDALRGVTLDRGGNMTLLRRRWSDGARSRVAPQAHVTMRLRSP